jgi:hypothetical protein
MIDIGDLVSMKVRPRPPARLKLGVVVKKHLSCSVLNSEHTRHIASLYPFVYYVLFDDGTVAGPLNASELELRQTRHGITSTMSG